jgi:hypothetical protein
MKNRIQSASERLKNLLNPTGTNVKNNFSDNNDDSLIEIDLSETSFEKSSSSSENLLSKDEIDSILIIMNSNMNRLNPEKEPMVNNYIDPEISELLLNTKILLERNDPEDIIKELKKRKLEKECQKATLRVNEVIQKLPYHDACDKVNFLTYINDYKFNQEEYPFNYNEDVETLTGG